MTPDEKRLLITSHLARLLGEIVTDQMPRGKDHMEVVADSVMNGWDEEVRNNQLLHHSALWDIIAPLTDGLAIYRAVDHLLQGRAGEPLTNEVREGIMLDVGRIIATHSRSTEPPRRALQSRSTGTTRVWGGAPAETKEDYRDGAGV